MKHLFFALLLFSYSLFGQTIYKGKVIDAKTNESLPFVNISYNNTTYGTTSDIDGNFTIKGNINTIQFSYVGYEPKTITPTSASYITVKLEQKNFQLQEVVINPEENPALGIIRKVIANRKINDIELRDYSCNLYNKFAFNYFIDTLHKEYKGGISEFNYRDSIDEVSKKTIRLASKKTPEEILISQQKQREEIIYQNNTPIMLLETYVEKKHKAPKQDKEYITASKMSGFKNPSLFALLTKIQSFSFYDNEFALQSNVFVSPISKEGMDKYFYTIEDTIYDNQDSIFVISYRPYKGKVFNGMQGVFQISSNKYALKTVTATPADTSLNIKTTIKQLYVTDEKNNWVPSQLLGKIDFDALSNSYDKVFGEVKTYVNSIDYESKVTYRDIDNIAFEIAPNAHKVDSSEWAKLRPISLTEGENFTQMDSLRDSIPVNLDNMLTGFKILMTGKIPFYKVSFDMDRFLNFNDFEGARLGVGLHTNKKLSKYVQIGGYYAYGLKDKQHKYGGDLNFHLSERREIDVNFSYQNDVIGSGKTYFFEDKPTILYPKYCHLFMDNMDNIVKKEAYVSFRALEHVKFYVFGNIQSRTVNSDYLFNRISNEQLTVGEATHFISEYGVSFRFAFRETFFYDGIDKFSLGTKYPVIFGKVTIGQPSNYGNLSYVKYDFKFNKVFQMNRIGASRITITSGLVTGNVPYTLLYNPDGIFNGFNISSNDAFETMRVNEFLSDKQVSLFYGHRFKAFGITKKFRPALEVLNNFTFGALSNPSVHQNITYKTLENGFYEAGVRLHDIIKINFATFGLGTFYRYGPNSFAKVENNFAYKFVVGFKF